jgi:hypothetical protein
MKDGDFYPGGKVVRPASGFILFLCRKTNRSDRCRTHLRGTQQLAGPQGIPGFRMIVHIATAITNKAAGMAIKAKNRATMSVTSSSFLISRNMSFIVLCLLSAGPLTWFWQLAFIWVHWPHAVYHSPDFGIPVHPPVTSSHERTSARMAIRMR